MRTIFDTSVIICSLASVGRYGITPAANNSLSAQSFLRNVLSVIFGSAAVVALIKQNLENFAIFAAALVTILSSIDLVVGYSRKAVLHSRLAGKFIELEKHIVSINRSEFSESQLAELTRHRLSIEAEEPQKKTVLDSICHNELLRAEGIADQNEYVKIAWWQRLFAQFLDWGQHRIVKPGYPRT
jgi:hypothetical protein